MLSKQDIFRQFIVYFTAILIFYLLEWLLGRFLPNPEIFSFAIILFIVIVFGNNISLFTQKIIGKTYYAMLSEVRQTLRNLNDLLDSSARYHDVTRSIFISLKRLFGDLPHAFYILEDDKYYPAHYSNINDDEILLLDIKAAFLKDINPQVGDFVPLRRTKIPADVQAKLEQAGISAVLPFPGHKQVFAFLATNPDNISFLRNKETRRLFDNFQKKAGFKLENTALIIDLEKKNYEIRKLVEVSRQILSSFDTKTILDFILSSLKSLINYDAAAIYLLDKSGKRLLNTSYSGYDPSILNDLHLKVGQGACGWVVQTRQVDVLDDVKTAEHYYQIRTDTRSQIALPILFDNQVYGVICLESDRIAFFNQNVVDVLQLFTHLAAIAIHNARQFAEVMAKQALEHDLINAGVVQKGLLVQNFPRIKGLHLAAVNIPSKLVSGDLYDVFKYNDGSLAIAIADVSGKGAPAALMMALILAGLRSQKKSFKTACDVVYRLNNLLTESTIDGKFATLFFGIISAAENKIIYTNAGHDNPILIKADGNVIRLDKGGVVLGFIADTVYMQDEIDFRSGDVLVAFTDGITEAMNDREEEFGQTRLVDLVRSYHHLSAFELRNKIIETVQQYSGLTVPDDDMTLIICKRE